MNYLSFMHKVLEEKAYPLSVGTFECRKCGKTYPNSFNVCWTDVCLGCDDARADADRERRDRYREGGE